MASTGRSIKEFDDGYDHDESETDFNGCGYSCDHQNPSIQSLSRFSVCKTTDEDYEWDHELKRSIMSMSSLSVESFDADGELSYSSESDKEQHTCYSLPATPLGVGVKGSEYASESETKKGMIRRRKMRKIRFRKRRASDYGFNGFSKSVSFSGESDQSGNGGGGSGLVMITRPKGGERALRMDLEEVKACRDLGFELEHEKMSLSGSNAIDTSSGGDSPISNWRISSPGDDPREVKARLKLWAQAVALVSASKNSGI